MSGGREADHRVEHRKDKEVRVSEEWRHVFHILPLSVHDRERIRGPYTGSRRPDRHRSHHRIFLHEVFEGD